MNDLDLRSRNLNWFNRDHSNIEVIVPDIGALEDAGTLAYNLANEIKADNMITQTWGYIVSEWGLFCLQVNGHSDKTPITDDRPYEFGLYPNFTGGMKVFSPWKKISLFKSEVLSLPVRRKLALEEFVNVWGRHEEIFFQQWVQHFETLALIKKHQESLRKINGG